MRPVSDAFLTTIRGSHEMVADARIVAPGLTGTNPTGDTLTVISGNVVLDGTAQVRSTLDLTVDGTGGWPGGTAGLSPYGNEIFVRRGVKTAAGASEWVSLGYYRIQSIEQDRPPDGPIRITGRDRMQAVIDARLLTPVQFDDGALVGGIVEQLVNEVYAGWTPTVEWSDDTDTQAIGRGITADEDRYATLNELITSYGLIWYWDHRGHLVVKPVPSPSAPVWDVDAGAGGVLLRASRELSRDGVYNAIVVSGEGADTSTPVRAVVVDNDPTSPTWWDGPFGRVPRAYSSPFVTSIPQALSAGASLLTRTRGLPYSVTFSSVTNPALEPYDPVRVRQSTRGGRETHSIDRLTIPLTADAAMDGTTRQQTVTLTGVI